MEPLFAQQRVLAGLERPHAMIAQSVGTAPPAPRRGPAGSGRSGPSALGPPQEQRRPAEGDRDNRGGQVALVPILVQ